MKDDKYRSNLTFEDGVESCDGGEKCIDKVSVLREIVAGRGKTDRTSRQPAKFSRYKQRSWTRMTRRWDDVHDSIKTALETKYGPFTSV